MVRYSVLTKNVSVVQSVARLIGDQKVVGSIPGQHCFIEIGHEMIYTVILSLQPVQEGQLLVSGERMHTSTG